MAISISGGVQLSGPVVLTQSSGGSGPSGASDGYASGGYTSSYQNVIQKFSFSTDGNATDVGDLTVNRGGSSGQSSSVSGYTSGGLSPFSNVIDKFPFASGGNASDVGDLINTIYNSSGQYSSTSGYVSGGRTSDVVDHIQKFSFSSDGNASDIGNLLAPRRFLSGQSSADNGYASGGGYNFPQWPLSRVIDKFSFASDGNSVAGGDILSQNTEQSSGQQSSSHGYLRRTTSCVVLHQRKQHW